MFKRALSLKTQVAMLLLAALAPISFLWRPLLEKNFATEDAWVIFASPPSIAGFVRSLFTLNEKVWYHRPVRHWLYSLTEHTTGPVPAIYTAWAVLLLFGAAGFLWLIMKRFLGIDPRLRVILLAAFLMSAPMAQPLFWTCSLHNSLCLFFASGALYFRWRGLRITALALFGLALFSRETAAGFVFPLIVIDSLRLGLKGFSPLRRLRASWDLVLLAGAWSAILLSVLSNNAETITPHYPGLGAWLGTLLRLTAATLGLSDDQWFLGANFSKASTWLALAFCAYLIWLIYEFVVRKRWLSLLLVALCLGGVMVPMMHTQMIYPEYALLLAIGVLLAMADGLQRLANRWSRPGLTWILLACVVIPFYFLNARENYRIHTAQFERPWKMGAEAIRNMKRIHAERPAGEIFRIRLEGDNHPDWQKRLAYIFLPRALAEFIPGRFFVFEGNDLGHSLVLNAPHHPLVAELLKQSRVYDVQLDRQGHWSQPKYQNNSK